MSNKKNKVFSVEDFRKLSIREQFKGKQNIIRHLKNLRNDLVNRERYLTDLKETIGALNKITEDNTPIFDKKGIYCTVDPGGHIEIETDNGLPSKKCINEFCAFLMKHFG